MGGHYQTFVYPASDTLANFKAWGQAISTGIAAAGWFQTADTGQVNWSTLAAIPSADSTSVYEVWQSQDAPSSTYPIYFRIEYFPPSTGTPLGALISVTVGSSSDGSGNITGQLITGPRANPNQYRISNSTLTGLAGDNNQKYEVNVSWLTSGGSFGILLWRGMNSLSRVVVIERSHDTTGADTDEYITVFSSGNTGSCMRSAFKPSVGGFGPIETTCAGWILPNGAVSASTRGRMFISPVFPLVGKIGNPLQMIVMGKALDVPGGVVLSQTMYGTQRRYMWSNASATSQLTANASNDGTGFYWG